MLAKASMAGAPIDDGAGRVRSASLRKKDRFVSNSDSALVSGMTIRPQAAADRRAHAARQYVRRPLALAMAAALATSGCGLGDKVGNMFSSSGPKPGTAGYIKGFLGGVAADEPRAVVVAQEVLSAGGNAADAAVALGFALAVTLPSRAGLGGGGGCIAYSPSDKSINQGVPEAILFVPPAPEGVAGRSDRPAALPMLARGLFALHAKYGQRPFESLLGSAEQMARFGVPASRALVRDIQTVAGPLAADPNARAVFVPGGQPLAEGGNLQQPELATTIAQIRVAGVGDMYQGTLAHRIEDGSVLAGGPLTVAQLRTALPRAAPALVLTAGTDSVAFLPPPADGGLAAAAAFSVLQEKPNDFDAAQARALAVAATWRASGGDPMTVLRQPASGGSLPSLPASTTFATLDKDGNAVVCALTMNNLFGTGRIVPGTGLLLAASPASVPPPLLAAGLAWNSNLRGFRAEAGGSGQSGAPMAVAVGLLRALRSNAPPNPMGPTPVPDPGRVNAIACTGYLPDDTRSCGWATDPRGAGLATGGG